MMQASKQVQYWNLILSIIFTSGWPFRAFSSNREFCIDIPKLHRELDLSFLKSIGKGVQLVKAIEPKNSRVRALSLDEHEEVERRRQKLEEQLGAFDLFDLSHLKWEFRRRKVAGQVLNHDEEMFWIVPLKKVSGFDHGSIFIPAESLRLDSIFNSRSNYRDLNLPVQQIATLVSAVLRYYANIADTYELKQSTKILAYLNDSLIKKRYFIDPAPYSVGGFQIESMNPLDESFTGHLRGPFFRDENFMTPWSQLHADVQAAFLATMPKTWFINSALERVRMIIEENPIGPNAAVPQLRFVKDWLTLPEWVRSQTLSSLDESERILWLRFVEANVNVDYKNPLDNSEFQRN